MLNDNRKLFPVKGEKKSAFPLEAKSGFFGESFKHTKKFSFSVLRRRWHKQAAAARCWCLCLKSMN